MREADRQAWSGYVEAFHAEQAGITETILRRCHAAGMDPYEWCAAALDGTGAGPTLDLASGSGPLADLLPGWVGADASASELAAARALGRGPLVRARADALPVADGSVARAACSMAWQVLDPFEGCVADLARVLSPEGQAAVLLPSASPVGARSALAYLGAQVVLRARIRYPNDAELEEPRLRRTLARHGLTLVTDERRRFSLPLEGSTPADLVRSLYLPGVPDGRRPGAARALSRAAGRSIDVPMRRLLVEKRVAAAPAR